MPMYSYSRVFGWNFLTRNAHAHILPRQCVRKQSAEADRSPALLTAREARLLTNLRALDVLRMTEVDIPKRD